MPHRPVLPSRALPGCNHLLAKALPGCNHPLAKALPGCNHPLAKALPGCNHPLAKALPPTAPRYLTGNLAAAAGLHAAVQPAASR